MTEMIWNMLVQQDSLRVSDSSEEQSLSEFTDNNNDVSWATSWKLNDVDIFWSNISVSYSTENVVDDDEKKWYYCNVHFFVIRIRVTAVTRDTSIMRQNLELCLKEKAQNWWTNQVLHVIWVSIMTDNNSVEKWVKVLERQFWEALSVTLSKLQTMRYTVQDAQSHWESSEYVTAIVTAVKRYEQSNTEFAQILYTFCDIDSDLHCFSIDESEKRMSVQNFIDLLNKKKVNWFDHYAQKEQKKHKEQCNQSWNEQQD